MAGSRPSRARGLKQYRSWYAYQQPCVAPLAGAWIETGWGNRDHAINYASRPSRARGLKLNDAKLRNPLSASRPSRARGLKLTPVVSDRKIRMSRPSRARGLKPVLINEGVSTTYVAPLAGAWIETIIE